MERIGTVGMMNLALPPPRGNGSAQKQDGHPTIKKCLTIVAGHAIVAVSPTRALSSVGERFVHTEEVTGSIPVAPTSFFFDIVPNNRVDICRYLLVRNLRNHEVTITPFPDPL